MIKSASTPCYYFSLNFVMASICSAFSIAIHHMLCSYENAIIKTEKCDLIFKAKIIPIGILYVYSIITISPKRLLPRNAGGCALSCGVITFYFITRIRQKIKKTCRQQLIATGLLYYVYWLREGIERETSVSPQNQVF